ncbi:hypothetical protein [uncultured Vibrio sp.]|nr:hypothetical protein [uncultured Vibrio sp.]
MHTYYLRYQLIQQRASHDEQRPLGTHRYPNILIYNPSSRITQ